MRDPALRVTGPFPAAVSLTAFAVGLLRVSRGSSPAEMAVSAQPWTLSPEAPAPAMVVPFFPGSEP